MDLSKLDTVAGSTRGSFLHLKFGRDFLYVTDANGKEVLGADGQRQPYGLEICGIDDPHFARLRDRALEERARMRSEGGGLSLERDKELDRDLVAHAVKGPGNLVVDGKPVPATHASYVALFTRFPWIFDQVNRAVSDRARFVGN